MLIFVSVFAAVCLAGYYYILLRLFALFKLKHNAIFWLMLVWLAFGYIIFSILDRKFPCGLCNFFLRLSAIGFGVGWLALVVLLSHDLLYLVFRFPASISRWPAAGTILILSAYAFINAGRIQIETIELSAPVNLNIVQWSDIHLGSVSRRHLKRLVEKTAALNPDGIFITGDLIDPQGHLPPDVLMPLRQLRAPIYWISGNHERYFGLEKAAALLKQAPVIPLRNEAEEWNGIQLVGIDDSDDPACVEDVLRRLQPPTDTFTILLYHQPEGYKAAAQAGVDLMLCGHTHNGQIWPFNWVVRSRFQYLKGLHAIDGMHLYISTGSGTWGPPMRLGSRNQITLIRLQADGKQRVQSRCPNLSASKAPIPKNSCTDGSGNTSTLISNVSISADEEKAISD